MGFACYDFELCGLLLWGCSSMFALGFVFLVGIVLFPFVAWVACGFCWVFVGFIFVVLYFGLCLVVLGYVLWGCFGVLCVVGFLG